MAPDPDSWSPSGLVTLLTDFGLEDAYVGVMKGVLASVAGPAVRAIDLTHAVAPQDVRAAAFHLAHAWRWFPAGTVHVAVCDPGVGTARAILVATRDGHAFLAPDNGLLGPVLAGAEAWVGRLDVERVALPSRSRTFHGRDVFAPAAARLAAGAAPAELALPCAGFERLELPAPEPDGDAWLATVLSVDRFGNLVGNVPAERVADGRWDAVIGARRAPLTDTYGDARPGELVALVDSYGLVELAVRDGSAARALGMKAGDRFRLERAR
jgi:hypothetical protein